MSVIVSSRRCARCLLVALPLFVALCVISPAGAWAQTSSRALGELDCNGDSPVQQSVKLTMACTDIRGSNSVKSPNIEDGRFYDNGVYIGHDEPDVTFLS